MIFAGQRPLNLFRSQSTARVDKKLVVASESHNKSNSHDMDRIGRRVSKQIRISGCQDQDHVGFRQHRNPAHFLVACGAEGAQEMCAGTC